MNKWFTSDFHFGHGKIIEYCGRPFASADIMDRELIRRYNAVVAPEDEVFILGDLTLKTRLYKAYMTEIVGKLHGNKHLVLGNHDCFKPFDYVEMGFHSVHTALLLPDGIALTHDPAVATVDKSRLWLCGHIHDLFHHLRDGNGQVSVVNVGVDVWDYKPVSLQEILELKK